MRWIWQCRNINDPMLGDRGSRGNYCSPMTPIPTPAWDPRHGMSSDTAQAVNEHRGVLRGPSPSDARDGGLRQGNRGRGISRACRPGR